MGGMKWTGLADKRDWPTILFGQSQPGGKAQKDPGKIRQLIQKLGGQIRCRNTRLSVFAEKTEGYGPQVIVQITDKCTGATYEAAFSAATARRVEAAFAEAIGQAGQM